MLKFACVQPVLGFVALVVWFEFARKTASQAPQFTLELFFTNLAYFRLSLYSIVQIALLTLQALKSLG